MAMYARMYRPYVGAAMGYVYSITAPIHVRIYGHYCPYIYMAVAAPIDPPIAAPSLPPHIPLYARVVRTVRGCLTRCLRPLTGYGGGVYLRK